MKPLPKLTLGPGAREKLSKVSGIILAHSGLKVELEGHTDNVGSDEYNFKLSDNRASSVRSYLLSQGVKSGVATATGYGKAKPVANSSTAAWRQQNRRVEMVVSGEMLGTSFDISPLGHLGKEDAPSHRIERVPVDARTLKHLSTIVKHLMTALEIAR